MAIDRATRGYGVGLWSVRDMGNLGENVICHRYHFLPSLFIENTKERDFRGIYRCLGAQVYCPHVRFVGNKLLPSQLMYCDSIVDDSMGKDE